MRGGGVSRRGWRLSAPSADHDDSDDDDGGADDDDGGCKAAECPKMLSGSVAPRGPVGELHPRPPSLRPGYMLVHPPFLTVGAQRRLRACLLRARGASSGGRRRRLRSALRPAGGAHPSLLRAARGSSARPAVVALPRVVSAAIMDGAAAETEARINKSSIGKGGGATTRRRYVRQRSAGHPAAGGRRRG